MPEQVSDAIKLIIYRDVMRDNYKEVVQVHTCRNSLSFAGPYNKTSNTLEMH